MEDAKSLASVTADISNSSQAEASAETRFTDLCKAGLLLSANTCTEAMDLYQKTKHLISTTFSSVGNGAPEETERYWFAFVLYSVKRLRMNSVNDSSPEAGYNGFTLSQILRSAKLNIVDFFKELPQFVVKAGPILSNQYGSDWEKRLEAKELQANFVHLSLLSKYYKRAFGEFFFTSDAKGNGQSAVVDLLSSVSDYYRFGWLLFLALRVHAFSRFKDLVTCTNGLVAILAILILHIPVRLRNFVINESPKFVKKGNKGVDLLASLCSKYETSEDELKETMEKANNIIADILKKDLRPAQECRSVNLDNINTEDLIYFEDLMDGTSLSSSLKILEKDYADAAHNKVELDERMFINGEDSLLGSGSLSGGVMNIGHKGKVGSIASPTKTVTSPLSPHRSPSASHASGSNSRIASTPVTTAMTTAKWLRTIISPLSPKPSPELEHFLLSCDRNLTNDVMRRANIILEAIFPSVVGEQCVPESLMDSIWAEQRKLEALKLYYRVLKSMCIAESQVLQSSNLTSLLTNERFHRCMLACSAELVLATHKTVTMLFPAVLERTGITAFDLSKVIESFVRHEESLPRELRRHLNSLEERLLEFMVWEKGSSMYNSLTVARPALSSEIIRLGLLAEPMPSLDAIALHMNIPCGIPSLHRNQTSADMRSPKRFCTENRSALVERNSFTSPVKDRVLSINNLKSRQLRPALQCAFASPTRPVPGIGGETCAEAAINVFFSKIMKLAAVRINGMVERLRLSQPIRESVYSLFQQILNQQTALFFNRHIDQILLCCFYGIAKISQLSLTFREIILNYRKQPHCKPQVFRSVFVDWSSERRGKIAQEHVDIIAFYNEVFVPVVKPLLVELAPLGTAEKSKRYSETNGKTDGQCPGSPKTSAFPSLPDMSPKKLSGAHNVYVSPLRSSKMDVLVSNGSKSYYACVGESTHAYQSPSKDLTAINTRLNGNRKVRGTLNFDEVDVGLVSDSVVANSLYLQNGSCASSSDAPVKTEQPDS